MKKLLQLTLLAALMVCHADLVAGTKITTIPIPQNSKFPKTLTDDQGTVHLVFNKTGNVYYSRKSATESDFSDPIQVNSVDGCAAVASLALGVDGRVHVLFHGNIFYIRKLIKDENRKVKSSDIKYTFYSRLNDAGDAFEEQVDVSGPVWGFDGGCTLASDQTGNVYLFFAGTTRKGNETVRQVFMRRSTDDGKTFAKATPIDLGKGVCACCHLNAQINHKGELMLAYRVAEDSVNRDSYVLTSSDQGETFSETALDKWELRACPGSSYSFAEGGSSTFVSLSNKGEIYLKIEGVDGLFSPPDRKLKRRASVMAGNKKGEVLVAWGEGENFNKPHNLNWQLYDKSGNTIGKVGHQPDAFARWGNAAIYTEPNGNFVILY